MGGIALVFGSGGQLGVEICREFQQHGWTVQRFDRQSLDITDQAKAEDVIVRSGAGLVVNAAAYNQVDIAENEPLAAYLANALAVRSLATACRQAGVRLVHYSTDYVYDGTKGSPYVETDLPRPLGAYGVSKLAGELYAQAYVSDALIIRTSGVFGPAGRGTARGNFIETMLRLGRGEAPIRVTQDHVASPAYAPAIASRTREMVDKNLSGLFHLGGGEAISWFSYAKLIFELAGMTPEIQPADERSYRTLARRPKYSALSNAKVEAAGVTPMPPMRQAIEEYLVARERFTASRSA
jgi:dTDP-4-dehydrorhamnose reductase